jgi:hypothetical protein
VRFVPARSALLLSLTALLAGGVLVGCGAGDVVDDQKTEIALQFDIPEATGTEVKSVNCPSDVPVNVGTRFTCRVVAESGDEAVAELEIVNDDADLKVLSLTAP